MDTDGVRPIAPAIRFLELVWVNELRVDKNVSAIIETDIETTVDF